jgi:hypothetical protein
MTVLCFRILVLHVLCMLEGARLFCSGFPGLPTLQRGRTDTFMKQHVLVQGCSQTKLLATNFENDGVLYRQSVCCKDEVKRMQNELSLAMKRLTKESSSIAQHRRGAQISRNTDIAEILESGSIHSLIQRAIDDSSKENESTNRMRLSKNIPIEVRLYEQTGACMAWHRDDVLYDPPQIEIVYTVENTSDCATMWKVGSQLYSAYIVESATFLGNDYQHQFGASKKVTESPNKNRKVIR